MVIHPHFIDRNKLTPSLWALLKMSFYKEKGLEYKSYS